MIDKTLYHKIGMTYNAHHHDGYDLWGGKNGSFQSQGCFLPMTMVGLICMMIDDHDSHPYLLCSRSITWKTIRVFFDGLFLYFTQ